MGNVNKAVVGIILIVTGILFVCVGITVKTTINNYNKSTDCIVKEG